MEIYLAYFPTDFFESEEIYGAGEIAFQIPYFYFFVLIWSRNDHRILLNKGNSLNSFFVGLKTGSFGKIIEIQLFDSIIRISNSQHFLSFSIDCTPEIMSLAF